MKVLIIRNHLYDHSYVEPFAGGAGVALSLLFEEYVDHIHINDIDEGIYAFWWSILYKTNRFVELIREATLTIDEWQHQRAIQTVASPTLLDLGFSTFYLNRTNRSGIISGGPIGGKHQDGPWKLNARFNANNLIKRINKVGRFRNRITITNTDAKELIGGYADEQGDYFFYIDPPYYSKGSTLYRNNYCQSDHVDLAMSIQSLKVPWVVSYDNVPPLHRLYSYRRSIDYSLRYSLMERYGGRELLIFADSIVPPVDLSPAKVPISLVNTERMAAVP